jgi:hypothetical protein
MSNRTGVSGIAVFCSGLVVGVAATLFLGAEKNLPTAPAAKAADDKLPTHIGRYQVFRSEYLRGDCLLDTATGKVWKLKAKGTDIAWTLEVDAPK